MKKILLLTSLFIISFSSMNFSGCQVFFWHILEAINDTQGARFDYGDNSAIIHYTISVGNNGTIRRSQGTDNLTFQLIPSGTTQRLNAVRVSNNYHQNRAVIAGNNGTLLYSTNTGDSWSSAPQLTNANLYGADHNYYIYAVGDNGVIVHADYFGGTWSLLTSGTTRNLKAVSISATYNSNVIVVGEKGTILRSTDVGQTWNNVSIPDTTFNFYDLSQKGIYYGGDIFVAVGSGGRIYKSTDVGATWQQKTSGTANTLRSVYFHTLDSGVVVGDNGTIRFTTNGGESWFTDPYFNSPSTRQYRSVSLVYRDYKTFCAVSDTMFFVSQEPLFLGIEHVSTAIPKDFSLSQNYPNPFNPTTKIRFELPKSSFAKLIVYDITGRKIQTLVNEELHTGVYEYEWNASSFPSGIYFYVLKTEDFSSTGKMILIK